MNNFTNILSSDKLDNIEQYTPDMWRNILKNVLNQLEEYLGCEIRTEFIGENFEKGFSVDICSAKENNSCNSIWKGILGADYHDEGIQISTILFFYLGGKKMISKNGESYILLQLNNQTKLQWKNSGWKHDEFGEYSYFDELDK